MIPANGMDCRFIEVCSEQMKLVSLRGSYNALCCQFRFIETVLALTFLPSSFSVSLLSVHSLEEDVCQAKLSMPSHFVSSCCEEDVLSSLVQHFV